MARTLDDLDVKLLKAIQRYPQGAPPTQVALGKVIAREKTPTRERLSRLKAEGAIRSWAAILDPGAINATFTAYVLVTLTKHSRDDLQALEKCIRDGYYERDDGAKIDLTKIMEGYTITGEADLLLKVVARDKADFAKFIEEGLLDVPQIGHVNSMVVLREVKFTTEYPEEFLECLRNDKLGSPAASPSSSGQGGPVEI